MANDQCVRVFLLLGIGAMEILPESGFDACTILVKLLHFNGMIHKIRMKHTEMENEWKSEWMKTMYSLQCLQQCAEGEHSHEALDASGQSVAAVQSVHPLR